MSRTIDYEILQTKLNETLGLLALKDIEIKEGLKTKAYEISVLNQKHDELVKKSLLTRSQLEGYLKENTKVISDLKELASINGCGVVGVSIKDVHLGEHRKTKVFLEGSDLQCPTCTKVALYSANHDEAFRYLSRLNPRALHQIKDAKSHKTNTRDIMP
ncbi:hypothetical protein Tco_0574217 [Tanacetum coccineum]